MPDIEMEEFPRGVLVVDDEPMILQLLSQALAAKELSVRTAASAEEAEATLRKDAIGCLLVDKNLPGMDGLELLRRTRALQPQAACLVMTGYASIGSAVEALRLGAADYVQKPFPSLQLVAEKVRLALDNAQARFERERFLAQLRAFEAELEKRHQQIDQQRTEIEIFNDVLEARVAVAEGDLRKRCEMLSAQLASKMGGDRAARLSAEMVLKVAAGLESRPESAPLRGELARIVRQLEDHLTLLG